MPIYNDPNHPHYGPCRRLHLILMSIFADCDLAAIEAEYESVNERGWTTALTILLNAKVTEATAQRMIISILLNCHDLLRRRAIRDRVPAV